MRQGQRRVQVSRPTAPGPARLAPSRPGRIHGTSSPSCFPSAPCAAAPSASGASAPSVPPAPPTDMDVLKARGPATDLEVSGSFYFVNPLVLVVLVLVVNGGVARLGEHRPLEARSHRFFRHGEKVAPACARKPCTGLLGPKKRLTPCPSLGKCDALPRYRAIPGPSTPALVRPARRMQSTRAGRQLRFEGAPCTTSTVPASYALLNAPGRHSAPPHALCRLHGPVGEARLAPPPLHHRRPVAGLSLLGGGCGPATCVPSSVRRPLDVDAPGARRVYEQVDAAAVAVAVPFGSGACCDAVQGETPGVAPEAAAVSPAVHDQRLRAAAA